MLSGRPHPGARIETDMHKTRAPATIVAPTRGRGSKPADSRPGRRAGGVAPTRGRGSKLSDHDADRRHDGRPHPGARIETMAAFHPMAKPALRTSPPPGGADRNYAPAGSRYFRVGRPHPGARIETAPRPFENASSHVAPTRGRGSKQLTLDFGQCHFTSPPPGGADRNYSLESQISQTDRRPHPGARIETDVLATVPFDLPSPPPGGADRNPVDFAVTLDAKSRPHPGARIETGPTTCPA